MRFSYRRSAVGALDQHGQLLMAASRTGGQVAFGPRQQVDDQTDDAREQNEQHPDDGGLHAARLCVLVYPDEQRDVDHNEDDRYYDEAAQAAEDAVRIVRVAVSTALS